MYSYIHIYSRIVTPIPFPRLLPDWERLQSLGRGAATPAQATIRHGWVQMASAGKSPTLGFFPLGTLDLF